MDGHRLASLPGFLDDRRIPNIRDSLNHIQFAESVDPFFHRGKPREFGRPSLMKIANVTKPIVDQPVRTTFQGRPYTAAPVMPTDNDVLGLQYVYGILQHGKTVHVRMNDKVGDIAMDKEFSRTQADDFVGWNTAVRTTDPEKLRILLMGQRGEKNGV